MTLKEHKLLQVNTTIQDLPDQPGAALSTQQLKERFDHFPELLRQKFNALIDDLALGYPDAQQMLQLTAMLDAYVLHTLQAAGEHQAGHVRVDNRSIVLDEQGRLCAAGSDLPVADRLQALAGNDNASLMTPLRVREALQEFAAAAPPQLVLEQVEELGVTAVASRSTDDYLARAVADASGCYLQIFRKYAAMNVVASTLQLPAAAKQLSWNSTSTALGFIMRNAETGKDEAHFAAVSGNMLKSLSKETAVCPAIVALQPLPDGRFAGITATGRLYCYTLSNGTFAALSGPFALPQAASAQHLAVLADGRMLVADGAQLHLYQPANGGYAHLASCTVAAEVAAMALQENCVAVACRSTDAALQTVLVDADGLHPGLSIPGGCTFAALSWQEDGRYLLAAAADQPHFTAYGWDGLQLRMLSEYTTPEPLQSVLFANENIWLGSSKAFLCMQLQEQPEKRYAQAMQRDFTAMTQGFYLLPNHSCRIYLDGERKVGEYCLLWGDSDLFTCSSGEYQLQLDAVGKALYLAMFTGEGWQIFPVYMPAATEEQVLSADATSRPLIPSTARQLLQQQGRRAATLVVAAADSANPQAADFVCSGTADHLVLAAAIEALPESGGRIVLLDGTFVFDITDVPLETVGNYQVYRPLQINKANVSICGMGNATRIRLKSGVMNDSSKQSHQLYMLTVNGSHFAMQDLQLDGNKTDNANGEVIGLLLAAGAVASRLENCHIASCNFSGCNIVTGRVFLRGNRICENFYGVRVVTGRAMLMNNEFFGNVKTDCYSFQSELQAECNHHEGDNTCYLCEQDRYNMLFGNYLMGYGNGFQVKGSAAVSLIGNYIKGGRDADYSSAGYPAYLSESSTGLAMLNFCDGYYPYATSNCSVTLNLNSKSNWNIS